MTKTKTLPLFIFSLLILACSLTAQVTPTLTPQSKQGTAALFAVSLPPERTEPSQTPTPLPQTCQVKTGIETGALNIRACGGISCQILDVIREGETLTISQTVDGWLDVVTASGLHGWINSSYTDCEATK